MRRPFSLSPKDVRRLFFVVIALVACAEGALPPDDLSSPSDPAPLIGHWDGELIAGGPIRRTLGLGHRVLVDDI